MTSRSITFQITGMTCGHCAKTIERAAQGVEGVSSPNADLASGTLSVIATQSAKPEAIVAAIEHAGYGARSNR